MKNALYMSLVLCLLHSPLLAAERIRIAVANLNVSFLAAGVAQNRGFFKEEGLEAEIVRISPPVSVASLVSADLDYIMVFGSVVRAAVRGIPVKVLASFVDGSTHALIARPGIKAVRELKGKTLGVGTVGDTSDVAARMMIRHYGVEPEKEMKILAIGRDFARLAALKERLIDVAVAAPPTDAQGKKLGFNVLARAYEIFRFPFIGLCATDKKIKERPDEIRRVLKALIRANRYMRVDPAGTVQVLADWGKVDREIATAAYEGSVAVISPDGAISEPGLRMVVEQAKKEAKIAREIALDEVSEMNILAEAQRELGLRSR
ncbi:MAG: ABC transporter substrate-binding protein [Deltaproteobacteria bacterium]|nr:ABC transporter substrate-binding protein [Deltaproteobacteria bacterium]